ncbi:tetratricopeptide repeat protein [Caldimonas thermodepolymerans]|uniref:protein O-GlcNAc transferase n=1 Tax=Caldimonas thermodepolymerans TaxID=215580 RepID=A0A2S5T0H3_9BURK|nr:tetratricopeptide repeat protein [Caldimonas thermodepolymerans]PPE68466.1 glycosyltransferase [Caldimonas thermodepolymerans]QPC30783.1 tetratricopeptide repeat protein [Caldimonas thermodepolymerans]RDI02596.1 putative O-linked N-acetylglucosamine transferase (SPINDLY family) [Caldimonas thermodepolymerans]
MRNTAHLPSSAPRKGLAPYQHRGHEFLRQKQWSQAERELANAVRYGSREALDWIGLSIARWKLDDLDGSVAAGRKALELQPGNTTACMVLTQALIAQQRFAEAAQVFEALPAGAPRDHDFHLNYGICLLRTQRPQEAIGEFLQALQYRMDAAPTHTQLGLAFRELKLYEEAVECFRTAAALDPHHVAARAFVAHLDQFACRWTSFTANREEYLRALHEAARRCTGQGAESTPFALVAMPHTREDFLVAARLESRRLARGVKPLPARPLTAADARRRLRIGYLSCDFHQHATALLITEMFERHDRDRFEVFLYSHGVDDGSPVRERLRRAAEHFVDVAPLSPAAIARRVHDDGIDILVDLKGHTTDNRFTTLAYRPTPVQASFLGFPGTTGADYVDYFIGDRHVTPLAHADGYSEKIAQMPHCYQPNDRQRPKPVPSTRAQWGLPEQAFLFACFNQSYKIIPETFEAWMDILRDVPGSCLWLLDGGPQACTNLRAQAEARGVDPQRLIFGAPVTPAHHLSRLVHADLMLDTWPCNAHTTASDAVWAGLPIVTLPGETFASRVAASLLYTLDLPELVCADVEAYKRTAVALARDPARLAQLRSRLAHGRDHGPLFDSTRFARDIEALYARMWERRLAGLSPDHLPAA